MDFSHFFRAIICVFTYIWLFSVQIIWHPSFSPSLLAQIRRFANRRGDPQKWMCCQFWLLLRWHRCRKCLLTEMGSASCIALREVLILYLWQELLGLLFCNLLIPVFSTCFSIACQFHWCRSVPRAYPSVSTNSLERLLLLVLPVKSDHDARSDLLITTCWQEWWRCWSVDLEKIDQRKTMQNWNWRARQELHFGRARIIAFSHKQQTINMWLSYLIIFTLPVIQIAWHIIILCQFI